MAKLSFSSIPFREPQSRAIEQNSGLMPVPVVQVTMRQESRLVLLTDPRGPGADRFRLLGMRLRAFQLLGMRFRASKESAGLRKLMVTSPLPEDGKSTIAVNLATALAEGGKQKVLLVEADLRHPSTAGILDIPPQPGLAECLQEGLHPTSVIQRLEPLGWYLLQAGEAKRDPGELLEPDAVGELLEQVAPFFDWVIIDTPPVTPLTDALIFSSHTDASLLVVRADRTPREAVEDALARLGKSHVLGVVFNGAEGLNRLYSKYYGYYGRS